MHMMRRWMDLVLVGERTARLDRPRLDGRLVTDSDSCPAADPAAGYVDTDLSYREGWEHSEYFAFAGRRSTAPGVQAALTANGATLVLCEETDGHVDPGSLLAEAHQRGLHCLMVEGGPRLASGFLAAGLVDRWVQYIAPVVVGGGLRWPDVFAGDAESGGGSFSLTGKTSLGRDTRLVYDRRSFIETLRRLTTEAAAESSSLSGGR
jgi:diaminohydroxyphosphoribosylaminopyrimidine deaminase/5-amino-6-(5-phosphoribosylamino)uracil reductase